MKTADRETALAILARLEDEPALGLSAILREAGVARSTFHDWRKADAELETAYQEAKAAGYENLAQECIEIADDGSRDYKEEEGEQGTRIVVDHDHIQRSKLRVDTRLKLLAKWYPERYGERVAVDHGVQPNLAERLKEARERLRSR